MNAALHYPQYADWPHPGWGAHRDYDRDLEAEACGCGPEDNNDYDAWRRAFPTLAWDEPPVIACMCGATHGRTHDIGDGWERCIESAGVIDELEVELLPPFQRT